MAKKKTVFGVLLLVLWSSAGAFGSGRWCPVSILDRSEKLLWEARRQVCLHDHQFESVPRGASQTRHVTLDCSDNPGPFIVFERYGFFDGCSQELKTILARGINKNCFESDPTMGFVSMLLKSGAQCRKREGGGARCRMPARPSVQWPQPAWLQEVWEIAPLPSNDGENQCSYSIERRAL